MNIDFNKNANGLVPVIVQDAQTLKVLMLGYMNREAYHKTVHDKMVTFFSRSKQRLWTKGEESGNFLKVVSIAVDCDNDSLLVCVNPTGPVCHTGTATCWGETNESSHTDFLNTLESVIENRKKLKSTQDSYVSSLFSGGLNKIAQKVGEEAVEMVIEAKDDDESAFLNESADLIFHYLILLQAKGYRLRNVVDILRKRHN
jgi:phosphoribosyl-ATP pyrophosphohydrolase/phosphoribosyl-AMP cyclohydrolase